MSVDANPLAGPGTSEGEWQPWLSRHAATCPVVGRRPLNAPVVVAPHPDDEVLAAGGLLALADSPVVIGLTDGEASHPHSPTVTSDALAKRRQTERREALRQLREPADCAAVQLIECRLPDGSLAEQEDRIADLLAAHLGPDRWCVAPWRHEGHPDHDAAGRAAGTACERTGAQLLSYPVWSWHWARPADARLPWERMVVLPLPPAIQARKAAAIDAFVSQIEPLSDAVQDAAILSPAILDRFRRPYEVLFR